MRGMIRPLISIVLIALSILGLVNVYSDNSDVVAQAGKLACPQCDPRLIQSGRSPISQTLTFQTAPATLVTVECKRGLIFVGDYECQLAAPR
jgi:hypothetical protein